MPRLTPQPISQTHANLFNGVSQQPAALRSTSQAEEQINMESSLTKGLRRRPPTQWVANTGLSVAVANNSAFHFIDRSPTEKWAVLLTGVASNPLSIIGTDLGAVGIITYRDSAGNAVSASSVTYLQSANPRGAFKLITVADYTFIVNRDVTPAIGAPAGYYDFGAGLGQGPQGSAQTFAGLPLPSTLSSFPQIWEVTGSDATEFSTYWVQATSSSSKWYETRPRYNAYGWRFMEPATLPYVLVKTGTNTFDCKPAPWVDRKVGSETNNPWPSFIGKKIRDVFFFRNRVGFVTNNSVVMSIPGDYFNFFRKTMTAVSDDDPIDFAVAHPRAPTLNFAVTHNKRLLIFGDSVQFSIDGGDVLSPRSFRADPLTEYQASAEVKPVGMGANVYFVQNSTWSARIREFSVSGVAQISDAFDTTAHCPTLIPTDVHQVFTCPTEGMLFTLSNTDRSVMYTYKVLFDDDGKTRLQSSWSLYGFYNTTIVGAAASGSRVYMIATMDTDTSLLFMDYSAENIVVSERGDYMGVYLDNQFAALGGAYDSVNNWTVLWNGYSMGTQVQLPKVTAVVKTLASGATAGQKVGQVLDAWRYPGEGSGTYRVVVTGNWTNTWMLLGIRYSSRYRLSQILYRNTKGNPLIGGRLLLRSLRVLYRNTAEFKVNLSIKARSLIQRYVSKYNSNSVPLPETSDARMTVGANAADTTIDLVADGAFAASFHGIEWEGEYYDRSRPA